jgi:serine/threonine-protein kinase
MPDETQNDGEFESARLAEGDRLGRYTVVRLIAAGGMGEVYLARDPELGRKVAVKVLNRKFDARERSVERFVREAKAASALNHPHILVIHEIGLTEAGSRFIVSEYVEGETLREVVNRRRMPVREVVETAVQVAGALAAAHRAGIIHRDIKPENIILRPDGYAKVLDFGLAKLEPVQPSVFGAEDETVKRNQTAEGVVMGTISYMSPEQARGERVDERTDIFSLGAVIYEMLSGSSPFAGGSAPERFANLLKADPPPLDRYRDDVPDALRGVVERMLSKDREDRQPSMTTVVAELKSLDAAAYAPRGGTAAERTVSNQETIAIEPQATAATGMGRRPAAWLYWAAGGLALLIVIGGASYTLVSRDRAAATANTVAGEKPRSAAYDLYLRGKVKVNSENREDNEAATRYLEQAVALDPQYAEAWAALAHAYNTRAFFHSGGDERKRMNENAEVAVEKALALNPNLAYAHFARGLILWTHDNRFPHEQTIIAYRRAIELDPAMDEAHQRLSVIYLHVGMFDEARQEIKKTIELNPSNTLARFRLAPIDIYEGRYEDAIEDLKTTPREVNPALVDRNLATALFMLGRDGEASAVVEDYLKTFPNDEGGNVTSVKAMLLARTGKTAEAEAAIARSIEIGQGFGHFHHTAYNIAVAYALMGRTADALKWLEDAADDGFPCWPFFEIDPNLAGIRKEQRYIDLVKRLKQQTERYRALIRS